MPMGISTVLRPTVTTSEIPGTYSTPGRPPLVRLAAGSAASNKRGARSVRSGARVAGCFVTLPEKTHGPLVICEGYATGASILEATGHSVVCAINGGNLLDLAKAIRERWPHREIIVAADKDQFTEG